MFGLGVRSSMNALLWAKTIDAGPMRLQSTTIRTAGWGIGRRAARGDRERFAGKRRRGRTEQLIELRIAAVGTGDGLRAADQ